MVSRLREGNYDERELIRRGGRVIVWMMKDEMRVGEK